MVDEIEVTLGNVLHDAATELDRAEMHSLAKGVRLAMAQLDPAKTGEAWIADILAALDEASRVVAVARAGKETVDLTQLEQCLGQVQDWGLDPEQRMGNALVHFVRILAAVYFAIEHEGEGGVSVANMRPQIAATLEALGIDERGELQQTSE